MPKALTHSEFISKATAMHGLTYDYTQTEYLPMPHKVAIRCKEHGVFMQKAGQHLFGKGCLLCANKIKGLKANEARRFWTTSLLQEKAGALHPSLRFDKFVYQKYETAGTVTCPTHGDFLKTPHYLLLGRGCPACILAARGEHWLDKAADKPATLYLLRIFSPTEEFFKVGVTIDAVARRYKSARDMPAPYQYEVLAQHTSSNARAVYEWEQSIIESFAHLRYQPKTRFGGQSECFSSADEILKIFPL